MYIYFFSQKWNFSLQNWITIGTKRKELDLSIKRIVLIACNKLKCSLHKSKLGAEGKETLLYRKMPTSTCRRRNRTHATDAKNHWMKSYWGLWGMFTQWQSVLKQCQSITHHWLLTNHLSIHMGQYSDHHLNQVIKLSFTNTGTWFAS